ncbi:PepSY domain-containing protein [Microbacterium sp. LS_15]|uniref:PepSY domain-containing protein n=1 Tax=Microbacterium sp. LS_15 TaxID=3055790 RepID=UPI0035C11275
MNDKTPNQDHSSDETTPIPSPDAPTVPVAPASATPEATETVPAEPTSAEPTPGVRKGRKRGLLIGGGVLAALLLAGGGVAVGAAIGDEFGDDDDRPGFSDGPRDDHGPGQGQQDGRPGDRGRDDDGPDGRPADGPVSGIGTASADEIVDIANAARGAAEGDVTSIDAKRDGSWEVELTTATGGETEVRVDAEGTATVVSSHDEDEDDTAPAYVLDDAAIRALVAAALAEADGVVTDLDADDDASSPYDAQVVTDDRRSIDIDFDSGFAVVGTDSDD